MQVFALYIRRLIELVGLGYIAAAFEKHMETYGGLDICINSAGIGNTTLFYEDRSDGTATWRHTVNVNLVAVIDCTRIAVRVTVIHI